MMKLSIFTTRVFTRKSQQELNTISTRKGTGRIYTRIHKNSAFKQSDFFDSLDQGVFK